jgi:hypothetical protein
LFERENYIKNSHWKQLTSGRIIVIVILRATFYSPCQSDFLNKLKLFFNRIVCTPIVLRQGYSQFENCANWFLFKTSALVSWQAFISSPLVIVEHLTRLICTQKMLKE